MEAKTIKKTKTFWKDFKKLQKKARLQHFFNAKALHMNYKLL